MAKAGGTNKDLAVRIQSGTVNRKEFQGVIDSFQKEIASALPVHLKKNAEKYGRQALSLFSANPKLQQCRPVTILSALMTASALGLDLNPALGQAYIIPYGNRKKEGNAWVTVNEAQFQLGYKGAISLAYRSGMVARIAAEVVRERDHFVFSKGLSPKLEHEEATVEDRGTITYAYAVANLINGGFVFDVWPISKVIAHGKAFSKTFYLRDKNGEMKENPKSPWVTDLETMAKKTMLLAIWKYLPVSTEILAAAAADETVKDDLSGVRDEADVLDVSFLPSSEDSEDGADCADEEPAAPAREPSAEG